jgi:hypothetical protein
MIEFSYLYIKDTLNLSGNYATFSPRFNSGSHSTLLAHHHKYFANLEPGLQLQSLTCVSSSPAIMAFPLLIYKRNWVIAGI